MQIQRKGFQGLIGSPVFLDQFQAQNSSEYENGFVKKSWDVNNIKT
jgi:hypothetical protein